MIAEAQEEINQLMNIKKVIFNVDIAYEVPINAYGDRRRIKGVLYSFVKLALS